MADNENKIEQNNIIENKEDENKDIKDNKEDEEKKNDEIKEEDKKDENKINNDVDDFEEVKEEEKKDEENVKKEEKKEEENVKKEEKKEENVKNEEKKEEEKEVDNENKNEKVKKDPLVKEDNKNNPQNQQEENLNNNKNNKNNKEQNINDNPERIKQVVIANPVNNNRQKIFEERNKLLDYDETENIINSKVKEMREKYVFSLSYSYGLLQILNFLYNNIFERIENNINETKIYAKVFKEISQFYQNFSNQIIKTNNLLKSSNTKAPKIFDAGINSILESTQNSISQNFLSLSNSLKNNIINKGPLEKIEERITILNKIKKDLFNRFLKIENRRGKLKKLFSTKYEYLFNTFLPASDQENVPIRTTTLEETQDFIVIIMDFFSQVNKLILKTNLFLVDFKDSIYQINFYFIEYTQLVKQAVLIYIQENKKLFNNNLVKDFDRIENYFNELFKPGVDHNLKINKIFETKELKEKMNQFLTDYKTLIKNSKIVKSDILNNHLNFRIETYNNLENFFENLLKINPQPCLLTYDDLILNKVDIKRDPGFFSMWKECELIMTKQNHILIFDKPRTKDFVNCFEISRLDFKPRKDNKKKFLFDLVIKSKGKITNYTGSYYYDALDGEKLKSIKDMYCVLSGKDKDDF